MPSPLPMERLFDDAGVFPPARLPMAQALRHHEQARSGPHGWVVGPFLCPVTRLGELDACVRSGLPRPPAIGVIVYDNGPHSRRASHVSGLTQLEAPLGVDLPTTPGGRVQRYLELPHEGDVTRAAEAIIAAGALAKVRCGGLTADATPHVNRLADVLVTCARLNLPLKATAGLHKPFRHHDADVGGMQHGFVNLLAAAAAAQQGGERDDVAALLAYEGDDARSLVPMMGSPSRSLVTSIGTCAVHDCLTALDELGLLD